MITVDQIKDLRSRTGISIAECKQALEAAAGDLDRALEALKERGAAIAAKKSDRALGAGAVSAYIHNNGLVGALVELACETDFVAKNTAFRALADDLAMHVAAFAPANPEELLAQPFVKEPAVIVADVIKQSIQKFGENIVLARFARFAILC